MMKSSQIANAVKRMPYGLTKRIDGKAWRKAWKRFAIPLLFAGVWIILVGGSYFMVRDFFG